MESLEKSKRMREKKYKHNKCLELLLLDANVYHAGKSLWKV